MRERRRKGAFCLVAALDGPARERAKAAAAAAAADRAAASQREGGGVGLGADPAASAAAAAVETAVSDDHVLGTLECSRHEFDGTPLVVEVEEQGAKIARLVWVSFLFLLLGGVDFIVSCCHVRAVSRCPTRL